MCCNPTALVLSAHHTPTASLQLQWLGLARWLLSPRAAMTQSCWPLPGLCQLRAQIPPLQHVAPSHGHCRGVCP